MCSVQKQQAPRSVGDVAMPYVMALCAALQGSPGAMEGCSVSAFFGRDSWVATYDIVMDPSRQAGPLT